MRKERKPRSLSLPSSIPTSNHIEQLDWSSEDYIFEDKESWRNSLDPCYPKLPVPEFKKYEFVYTPDSQKQLAIKLDVADYALKSLLTKYDINYENDANKETHRPLFLNQMNNFFCSLRMFHPLTVHTKCDDFHTVCKTVQIYTCPLGRGAQRWRKKIILTLYRENVCVLAISL